ncbi:MAG: phage portal protein [Phycisphaeraceae bacterium]|nr:phage portal protein [Phycisphaeraceae bacterium]
MSVLFTHNMGNVWSRSGESANGVLNRTHLAWLTPAERCRAERLRQARMMFEGKHREYYVDEKRSAHSFPPLRQNEPAYFRGYNLLTLIAEKMADILFGDSPRLYIDDDPTQKRVDAIAERSWLMALLLDAAAECCWAGETFLEVELEGLAARISHACADQVFPQGLPGADQQYGRYVRYATKTIKDADGNRVELLLETHYTAGLIERKLYRLDRLDISGPKRSAPQDLALWPQRTEDGAPLPDTVQTGLSRPSIVRVPNGFGARSDYDGLIEQQDSVHAANTQIGRVLAKHADPRLAAPESAVDPTTGTVPVGAEVFFFRTKDDIPQYITWNAELASAMEDRNFALTALATVAEMPLSLLGIKDDSSVETAAKMRLAAAPALAKAQRKAVVWREAIRMAISLAIELETGVRPAAPIGVEMRDGLPDDETERATVISTLRTAGVMSRKRALQQQWLDAGSVRDELAELDSESAAATPSVLFGEPNAQNNNSGGEQ